MSKTIVETITPEVKQVKKILMKHKGKRKSITSAEIADMLGIDDGDTHSQVRYLIKRCVYSYPIPLAGDVNGYYIITSQEELDEYCDNLELRARQIHQRKNKMKKFYQEWA